MKVRETIKLIEKDGWYLVRQKGSHKQYKHPEKSGPPGTLNSILKQAGLKGRD
ncbi:MAG: type II toxin-antitoxin system HicA family toxin [Bacillota bacterium]